MEQLIRIQNKLKVPKNQYNNFGKYKYRSCEDILEAVKPLLKEEECYIVLEDSIELIGERYYLKAVATILNKDGASVSASAYAREPLIKKGMDDAQITGSTSSYARKYALNGLFAIDDSKDIDSMENNNAEQPPKEKLSNERFAKAIEALKNNATTKEDILKFDLTKEQKEVLDGIKN